MLRRHSTKSRSDPRRPRSTPSVHSVCLEYLDATIAQRDAQIAAHHAFDRAKNRSSTASSLFPQPPAQPRQHETEHKEGYQGDSVTTRQGRIGGYQRIRRQQSVRFVGPCSVPPRTSSEVMPAYTKANARQAPLDSLDIHNSMGAESPDRTRNLGTHPPEPSREAPPLPYSSTVSEDYLHDLLAGEEYYIPEDDIASIPSSYRRLRRSKSMLTGGRSRRDNTRYTSDVTWQRREVPGSASPRILAFGADKENVRPETAPVLRAPKSMSFLNPRRGQKGSSASRQGSQNTAYHPGDGLSTGYTQHLLLCSKSSMLRGPRTGRTEFGMRRSLRSSSSNSGMPTATTLPSSKPSTETGLKTRARLASQTLKSRLRKLFSLAKSEDETALPEQHIQSHKSYDSEPTRPLSFSGCEEITLHPDVGRPIYNVASATPTIHAAQSHENLHSSKGSVENLTYDQQRKVSDARSRVTSWTNSGFSTLTSQKQRALGGLESQQLSAIKDGDAQPLTPPQRRPRLGALLLHPQEGNAGLPTPREHTTDSQRMFSALMKRLHETNQLNHGVKEQSSSVVDENSQEHSTPLTVRCVAPEYNPKGPRPQADEHTDQAMVNQTGALDWSDVEPRPKSCATYPESISGDEQCFSKPSKPNPPPEGFETSGGTISDRRSAFFGSPNSHLFRTVSPYRRALRESMEGIDNAISRGDLMPGSDSSETGTLIYRTVPDAPDEADYSESVYSYEPTEGGANRSKDSVVLRDEFPEPPSTTMEDVSISMDPPVTYRPTTRRVVSSVSSVDWKTWLSANVAKLEPSPSPSKPEGVASTTPTVPTSFGRGHIRERTQIEGDEDHDDETLPVPTPPLRRPPPPTTPLAAIGHSMMEISPYQRSAKTATLPAAAGTMTRNDNPNYTLGQHFLPVNLEEPQTPPAPINITPKTLSPAYYQTKPTDPTAAAGLKHGWASELRPPPLEDNTAERNNGNNGTTSKRFARTRSLSRLRAAGATSCGSPAPRSARLLRRGGRALGVLPPEGEACGTGGVNKENEVRGGDGYGGDGGGLFGLDDGGQAAGGSNRMVEMFLSSRRRRLVGSDESDAFV